MSKVIIKVGPETQLVAKEDITTITYGNSPQTTIKFARNNSVVLFDRNPYYVTITEPSEVRDICSLLRLSEENRIKAEEATRLGNTDEATEATSLSQRYCAMASMNIESIIAAYVSRNLFDGFGTSIIKALRNAKNVGYRAAERNLSSNQATI